MCIAAFLAGFVDSIVGGGGLIQTPAALVILPNWSVATVIGTLKIPAFSGTSIAATQYARRVSLNFRLLLILMVTAFIASWCGSALLVQVSNAFMKPFLFFILIAVAIYTFFTKSFGSTDRQPENQRRQIVYGFFIALILGFYDGFIGPGAGSFLLLAFITLTGFDFLHASAYAKFVNLATNLGSILFFS
ncbi:MAG TPA: TSUP family transporter, partial [Flavitalea sp.]|nr:TSUP family transporter [Flavitalea sp.]